jgi:alkylation response protein AidB-like acyl-CoA dehydrogenase
VAPARRAPRAGESALAFEPSEEQRAFRESLRRFLGERAPAAARRRAMQSEAGYDAALWRAAAAELGLAGLCVDERHGGQGFGPAEQALVQRELGAALACVPYFSSAVLAGGALSAQGPCDESAALLSAIAAGETAALAWVEPGAGFALEEVRIEAHAGAGGFRLRGVKTCVVDGSTARHLLVVARLPGSRGLEGLTLLRVEPDAPGLARRRLATFDLTRPLARLELGDVPATPLGVAGEAGPALARACELATVALANEMVGVMERAIEMAVGYAKQRTQFGRPIGAFQAIKHKCADLWIELEAARAAADHATEVASRGAAGLAEAASVAKAWCSDVCFHTCAENIQIHGGIGFTWEHDAHLFFRRAKSAEIFLGDAAWHRERLAAAIGLGAAARSA